MPGKQIRFPLNKLEIWSHQIEVLEAHGLIPTGIYVSKDLDSHKTDRW